MVNRMLIAAIDRSIWLPRTTIVCIMLSGVDVGYRTIVPLALQMGNHEMDIHD